MRLYYIVYNHCEAMMTIRHIWSSKQAKLLIPLNMLSGIQNTFIMEAFTAGYVSCTFGVGWVGLVMVAYGIASCVTSYLIGWISTNFGWLPILILGCIVSLSVVLFSLFEIIVPNPDGLVIITVASFGWGCSNMCVRFMATIVHGELFSGYPFNPIDYSFQSEEFFSLKIMKNIIFKHFFV